MDFLEDIKEFSSSRGFVDFGVSEAVVLKEEKEYLLEYLQAGFHGRMGYLERNPDQRCDPSLLVDHAASIWIFLAPYSPAPQQTEFGRIAGYAQGVDYHPLIRQRLYEVLERIRTHYPMTKGRAFTDSAPLLERAWAVRCGLGFIGRNGMFIHPEYGSRVLIGALVLDLPVKDLRPQRQPHPQQQPRPPQLQQPQLQQHKPMGCGHCHLCLEHCPGQALVAPYRMDARKCIAYRTLEEPAMIKSQIRREGLVVPERTGEARPISGWLYGCDICQEVCPWNKKARQAGWSEFSLYQEALRQMRREDWEQMTMAEFEARFPDSPLLRCGLPNLVPTHPHK